MKARYLRVKDWQRFQHYRDRNPPWIKLYQEVLTDTESAFAYLTEAQQWQLVRIWLLASRCEIKDAEGVPLLAYDETWLRRGIRSLKRVEIEALINAGLLEVVAAEDVDAARAASNAASTSASESASTDASADARKSPLTSLEEVSEVTPNGVTDSPVSLVREAWEANSPPLIRHRDSYWADAKTQRAVRSAVHAYGDDVAAAIASYASVIDSETHFFKHSWTCRDFLARGLDKFVPEAKPLENFRRDERRPAWQGASVAELATVFDHLEDAHEGFGRRALGSGN